MLLLINCEVHTAKYSPATEGGGGGGFLARTQKTRSRLLD